jgi:hypothetical protein
MSSKDALSIINAWKQSSRSFAMESSAENLLRSCSAASCRGRETRAVGFGDTSPPSPTFAAVPSLSCPNGPMKDKPMCTRQGLASGHFLLSHLPNCT